MCRITIRLPPPPGSDNVQRKLEWCVLVWPDYFKERYCGSKRLKVKEVEGVFQILQKGGDGWLVDIGPTALDGFQLNTLRIRQCVVPGNIDNLLSMFLRLLST
jgi:hypothetical protein